MPDGIFHLMAKHTSVARFERLLFVLETPSRSNDAVGWTEAAIPNHQIDCTEERRQPKTKYTFRALQVFGCDRRNEFRGVPPRVIRGTLAVRIALFQPLNQA
jgi:hypothetical protein